MRLEMSAKLVLVVTLLASGAAFICLRAQTNPQGSQQPPAENGAARQHDHSDSMPGMNMDGMKMDDDSSNHAQTGAMQSMAHSHHMAMDAAHMRMTPVRPVADGDRERAQQIVDALAPAIQKYKDYHVALAEGYRIFVPNVPQPVISLHELLEWIPRRLYVRSRPANLSSLQENERWIRVGRRHVHRAQNRDLGRAERARSSRHRPLAPAYQSLHTQGSPGTHRRTGPSSA